jgi:hypothetical protein
MELILVLAVIVAAGYFFIFRDKKAVKEATSEAPYKVETTQPVVPAELPKIATETESPVVKPAEETKAKKQTFAKKAAKSPAKAEVAAKRTRKGGKFVGDDKSTTGVNEAFKDGKSPKKPKMTVAK